MTKQQNPQPEPDETTPPEQNVLEDEVVEIETPQGEGAAEQEPEPDLQTQIEQLNEKLLRSMADYQNLARRSQVSIKQAREQALAELGRAMITALDHFDHAVQVNPDKVTAQSVLDGVTMVRDELVRTLGQFEIHRIDANPGDEFDPNQHEALMRTDPPEDGSIASGHIVQQLQPGYRIGDRIIRPAQVSLANEA